MFLNYTRTGVKNLITHLTCQKGINSALARLVNLPIILMFHRVKQRTDRLLDRRVGVCNKDDFKKVLLYLKAIGYQFVSLNYLVETLSKSKTGRFAALTFDDGYKDLYQNVFPILKKHNIPFTLFLITSTVDAKRLLWLHRLYLYIERVSERTSRNVLQKYSNDNKNNDSIDQLLSNVTQHSSKSNLSKMVNELRLESKTVNADEASLASALYLSSEELLEMRRYGLQVEPHGHEHWPLNVLNAADTKYEIHESVKYIWNRFNYRPNFFAGSFGSSNQFADSIVAGQGLKCILTVKAGFPCEQDLVGVCRLPRIGIDQHTNDFPQLLTRLHLGELRKKLKRRSK